MEKDTHRDGEIMEKIATFIVDKRKAFYLIFIVAFIFCAASVNKVRINTDITSYLPEDTETKKGLTIMEEEFLTYGSAKIMVENITYEHACELEEVLADISGVKNVDFRDKQDNYQHASALYEVTFADEKDATRTEKSLAECKDALAGLDVTVYSEVGYDIYEELKSDMGEILLWASLVILIVLFLTSRSYAEILVFVIVFGVSALLNMGTNYWFGEISYITNAIAVVLQLALAIDYAIILCHRYMEEREVLPVREAIIKALAKAIPEIFSSSLTTIAGLLVLMFMQLKIGLDLGLIISKGIFCSLITVFLLMPGLLFMFSSWIEKTLHKNFVPKITAWGRLVVSFRYFLPLIFAVVLFLAVIFSSHCVYVFDIESLSSGNGSIQTVTKNAISDVFGKDNVTAVIVPAGDYAKEGEILKKIEQVEGVRKTIGLANVEVDDEHVLTDRVTPRQFSEMMDIDMELVRILYQTYGFQNEEYQALFGDVDVYEVPIIDMFHFLCDIKDQGIVSLDADEDAELDELREQIENGMAQLQGEHYSRLIVSLDTPVEGAFSEDVIRKIRKIAESEYDEVYLVGNSTSALDLKASFAEDNQKISILTILFVAVILLFTFQSAGIPVLLILTIQGSIWINFSFPFLTDDNMYFLSYLIISAIQMGATIDYAIVITNRFQAIKGSMSLSETIVETINQSFPTILTSGSILTISGFLISWVSSDPTVASIGLTLGRGSLISIILVMSVLPEILLLGNALIEKTAFTLNRDKVKKMKAGTVNLDGHVRGYVSGIIDADMHGFIRGDISALIDTRDAIDYTEKPEEGGERHAL